MKSIESLQYRLNPGMELPETLGVCGGRPLVSKTSAGHHEMLRGASAQQFSPATDPMPGPGSPLNQHTSVTVPQALNWRLSNRADPRALPLADAHYNRQKPGSPQFVPPGRCIVLLTQDAGALWVTSWPFAEYVKHQWAGAWVNSCFRRERGAIASELIREAVAVTRYFWEPPALGMVTFINTDKTRHKRDPGRCYRKAGFIPCGYTKGGLFALRLSPLDMPEAMMPSQYSEQASLFALAPQAVTASDLGECKNPLFPGDPSTCQFDDCICLANWDYDAEPTETVSPAGDGLPRYEDLL